MTILHHDLLDALLGVSQPALIEEFEPLFWEAIHDAEIQAAFLRGELPPAAAGLRPQLQAVLVSLLPATVEELAERLIASVGNSG